MRRVRTEHQLAENELDTRRLGYVIFYTYKRTPSSTAFPFNGAAHRAVLLAVDARHRNSSTYRDTIDNSEVADTSRISHQQTDSTTPDNKARRSRSRNLWRLAVRSRVIVNVAMLVLSVELLVFLCTEREWSAT